MYTESNVKPELMERYPTLVRINYGVEAVKNQDSATMYHYQMKEYEPSAMPKDADTLAEELMQDRYPLEEQVKVLSSEDQAEIISMKVFQQDCQEAARQIFGIPDTVKSVKERKLTDIAVYDQSANVNSFTIQGETLWLDRNTRAALMRRFEAEKASGVSETTLWYGASAFKMPVDTAITMLNAIEIYACKCYDTTAAHKADVNALESIGEIEKYNYTSGYPDKLTFTI